MLFWRLNVSTVQFSLRGLIKSIIFVILGYSDAKMSIILPHNQGTCGTNQSTDLLCKLMDWFLNDKDTRHERVKTFFTHHTPKVCSYMSQSRISFFCLFFSIRVFFQEYHDSQGSRVRGGYFFNSSLPLPPALQTIRHQPGYCCRELTSAHSWQLDSNQKPLVSYRKSLSTKQRAL